MPKHLYQKGHIVSEETRKKLKEKIPWSKGLTKETDERVKKISETLKRIGFVPKTAFKKGQVAGNKNPNWRGGIKNVEHPRNSFEVKGWRIKVFTRDNWTCQVCGEVGGKLSAHHIKSWKNYPELRFEVSNGITLCEDCHKLTDNYGGKSIKN